MAADPRDSRGTDPATWNYAPGQVHSTYAKGSVSVEAHRLTEAFKRLNDAGVLMQKDVVAFAAEATQRIAMRTPVDTGRARASWHMVPPNTSADGFEYSDRHGEHFDGSLEGVQTGPMEAVVGTNVQYMIYLEAGHSRQAPNGMVALTLQELRGRLEQMVADTIRRAQGG
jgi:hypothetical protein